MRRAIIIAWCVCLAVGAALFLAWEMPAPPVRVGVLHSQTGTMAVSEQPVIDATLLAIEHLNQRGGVLGREIIPVVADGRSEPAEFARQAQHLIDAEQVAAIFGCWTSASRKEVKEVVEQANHLLVYPVQYEGVEDSPCIVYTGLVPNQQVKPAVKWALDNLGNRFFLLGSDYIYPHVANALIRDLASFLGASVVGEQYVPLGDVEFEAIVEEIVRLRPAVIFNTLNGDSNLAFFAALNRHGITAAQIPVLSFSIGENELQQMVDQLGKATLAGHYAAAGYFQTLPGKQNREFLQRFAARYGDNRRVSDPMVAAYYGVVLWAQAVEEAGSIAPIDVYRAFARQGCNGPGGIIYVDDVNRHAWRSVRIGRINNQGLFDMVWDSQKPVQPEPYPFYGDENRWQALEDQLYEQWGKRWENPGGAGQ